MDSREQKAKEFAKRWAGRGRERSESQSFWLSLLGEVYGIAKPDEYIRFEENLSNLATKVLLTALLTLRML